MPIQVKICVPTKQIAEFEAEYVRIPSEQGNMGVLPNHAPLRCVLEPGVVHCRLSPNKFAVFAVSTGLAVIENNLVTVLADSAERAEEIDVQRASAARDRARERVLSMESRIDRARAEAALKRSVARIQAAASLGPHAH